MILAPHPCDLTSFPVDTRWDSPLFSACINKGLGSQKLLGTDDSAPTSCRGNGPFSLGGKKRWRWEGICHQRWKLSETLNMGWVLFVQSRNLQRKEMGHFSALDIIAFSTCSAAQAFFFTQELYQQSGQIIIAFYQPKEWNERINPDIPM